ncbi:geranylgeranyl reductase [Thioalkalivibrio denitrificans]|uniref:Geranylgeranyl reductase n=1 Tax=Thioalkalivibrio denitrificans TaxID=108003 RepID=A0A1V3NBR7_9GAMM|nr:NAD(P)/FAD-dependent oxidoreductase [Thioalkalivibrio denitrificans]OOG22481.1 geranylgeranyl reductase [Thioalkalivibrio denitrificans]
MSAAADSIRSVDVLVVGLGPGGASAARTAAGAGLTVLGVERNKMLGEPVQCAEFIPTPMGGYARAEKVLLQRITGMKSMLPSGAVHESDFPGLMINRAEFDRAIAREAERVGAELWTRSPLVALDADAHIASVRRDDVDVKIRYRVLIAADGPHSPVAACLGLAPLDVVQTRQYTVPLLRPYADTDIWLSDDYPGGYAWLFPKGKLANLGLGADRRWEDNLKDPLGRLHRQLVDAGLLGEEILYRTGGAIPVGGLRERLVVGDVLFVGDAAGLTHPITGAGIAAGVVSGELAGKAAAAYLNGDADAFEDYEEDVRDQFQTTLARAVQRRRELAQFWRTRSANEDATQRRGWIAFNEYFESAAV